MTRGSAAVMLELCGGVYPPPHDATSFLAVAVHTDGALDTMALPGTLSTTDTKAVALANHEAVRLISHGLWLAAGGTLSGAPEPMSLYNRSYYNHVERQVKKIMAGTSYGPVATVDMLDTSV